MMCQSIFFRSFPQCYLPILCHSPDGFLFFGWFGFGFCWNWFFRWMRVKELFVFKRKRFSKPQKAERFESLTSLGEAKELTALLVWSDLGWWKGYGKIYKRKRFWKPQKEIIQQLTTLVMGFGLGWIDVAI